MRLQCEFYQLPKIEADDRREKGLKRRGWLGRGDLSVEWLSSGIGSLRLGLNSISVLSPGCCNHVKASDVATFLLSSQVIHILMIEV